MHSSSHLDFQKFSASNGLLRVIILILSVIILGLGTGSFNANPAETYFVIMIVLSFVLATAGLVIALLNKAFTKSKAWKNMDYLSNLYIAWFLFNASVAKLLCARRLANSDSVAAVRILSGVFGLLNSSLFFWLGYLTAAEKQSFPCRLSSSVNDFHEQERQRQKENNLRPLFVTSDKAGEHWSWARCSSWANIKERVQCSLLMDGGIMQARVFSLAFILINLIFIAESYIRGMLTEEYFLAVVCINFVITTALHLAYLLGLSSFVDHDLRIFDKSYHICGSIFLFVGGTFMLASTISRTLGFHDVPLRTFASLFGILNSFLYGYIGLKESCPVSLNSHEGITDPEFGSHQNNFGLATNGKAKEQDKLAVKQQSVVMRQLRPSLIFDPGKM